MSAIHTLSHPYVSLLIPYNTAKKRISLWAE